MALVHVAADDPHLLLVDDVARGVPALPILSGVERRIEKSVGFVQPPLQSIGRTPHLIGANARKLLLVAGIPTANKPHTTVKRQRSGSIARGKRRFRGHL